MPAWSVLADEGSGGARKTTFHAVSVLSRVMLATLSCVTFANRSYVVGTGEGPPGSSTTEKGRQLNHLGLAIQLHTVSHFQTLQREVDNSGVFLLDKVVLHEPLVVED